MQSEKRSRYSTRVKKEVLLCCLLVVLLGLISFTRITHAGEESLLEATAKSILSSLEANALSQQAGDLVAKKTPESKLEPVKESKNNIVSSSSEPLVVAGEVLPDGRIKSLSFGREVSIRDALRFLAAKYHRNIVPSDKVDGLISVATLYDVSFEEALEAIIGKNFEYETKDNMIEVFTKGDVSRMTYRVFLLRYITAAEARKLVMPVLSEQGRIESTTAALTGVPTGESISAPSGGGDTMSVQDTIVVYDFAENIANAEKVIAIIDIKPKQVLIEATILSVILIEGMELGVDWDTIQGRLDNGDQPTEIIEISKSNSEFYGSEGTNVVESLNGGLTIGILQGNVAAFIKAIETVTDTTILANPKILAVNKQLGQVYIGTKIGYLSQTSVSDGTSTAQVKFLDTGTKLSFRPFISDDGSIRMDIHSKDSSGQLKSGLPEETSTEIVSNIIVQDEGTIVIGGLFRDKITTTRSQIPLLGDIPYIGALFRGTSDKVERQEVIVLLTPHIIEDEAETEGVARIADIDRKRYGAHMEQAKPGRARIAEEHYAKAAKFYIEGNNEAALDALKISLRLRPGYLEALRLQERIIQQTDPDADTNIERIMIDKVEEPDTKIWNRR